MLSSAWRGRCSPTFCYPQDSKVVTSRRPNLRQHAHGTCRGSQGSVRGSAITITPRVSGALRYLLQLALTPGGGAAAPCLFDRRLILMYAVFAKIASPRSLPAVAFMADACLPGHADALATSHRRHAAVGFCVLSFPRVQNQSGSTRWLTERGACLRPFPLFLRFRILCFVWLIGWDVIEAGDGDETYLIFGLRLSLRTACSYAKHLVPRLQMR